MASPPEVHSALLSSGPGPGSLLAAAAAWNLMGSEYASVADELTAVLGSVQAGAWEGPSAESYVAAHAPYLAWLTQESANSTAKAAEHETMAAAYTTALAAMPTLPELAANHAVNAALVATNFFGINTIPIALNELQYVQMWIQAAITMAIYQAQADAIGVLTELQNNPAVPPILRDFLSGISDDTIAHDPTVENPINDFIANILQNFGINWSPGEGTVNGLEYDEYVDPSQSIFWVVRALELTEDFEQFGVYLTQDPVLAVQYLISVELFDFPLHITPGLSYLASQPGVWAAVVGAAAAPAGSAGALAGLAGLADVPAPAVAPAPVAAAPSAMPVAAMSPSIAGSAVAPAPSPAPAPASAATTAAGSPPPPGPPAAGGAGFAPPYIVAPPGIGFGSGMRASASSSAKRKAPEPDTAAAAAAAAAREAARARRRQRAKQRDHGDEFMDMNVDVDPDWTDASNQGGGNLGFAGTARKVAVGAAGLTTLAGDDFGGGPRMPMVPGTWDPDGAAGNNEQTPDG